MLSRSLIAHPDPPIATILRGTGKGTIAHLVNDNDAAARLGAARQALGRYP